MLVTYSHQSFYFQFQNLNFILAHVNTNFRYICNYYYQKGSLHQPYERMVNLANYNSSFTTQRVNV